MSVLFVHDDFDIKVPLVMDAEEFEALPKEFRAEIVDGVLQPMNRPTLYHQEVVHQVTWVLKSRVPEDLRAFAEVAIRFRDAPVHERHPDVVVARRDGLGLFAPALPPAQVMLVVEVVSPGSETVDRIHKPAEYAAFGIPFFWRVEIQRASLEEESAVAVQAFRNDGGVYRSAGLFGPKDFIEVAGLEWACAPVEELIPRV